MEPLLSSHQQTLSQSQAILTDLMFQKGELCFLKARQLYESHLGQNHRKVGDCTYSLALLYKHHMKLAKSMLLMREALYTYQNGIGMKSLKCAYCLEEMGKISIMQEGYSEAYVCLEECLEIKRELYRYKP